MSGSEVGVVTRDTDKIDIFWTGRDGAINSHFFSEQKTWAEHSPFTLVRKESPLAARPGGSVSAVSRDKDKIDIFWSGNGGVNTHFFSELKPWDEHPPFILVNARSAVAATPLGAVASVSRAKDKIDLFWAGRNGALNSLWWSEAKGWELDHRTAFSLSGGGRWYPTLLTLSDGRVLAMGGHPASTDDRHWNNTPEIYDPNNDTWTIRAPLGDLDAFVQYPRMHVLPDGEVFCATPVKLAADGRSWLSLKYDPNADRSSVVAPLRDLDYLAPGIASQIATASVLLPLRPSNGYAASVLLCGGSTPLRIDLSEAEPSWKVAGARRLSGPRYNLNAVLLPTGEVFVSGGVAKLDNDDTAVLTAEMYDPNSNTWEVLEAAEVVRNYHSVALLMPDGAVWTAGSNENGKPGVTTRKLDIEIYEPWYFSRPRPDLIAVPSSMSYARGTEGAIAVKVARTDVISEVAIVRTSSTTHAFSSDQRYVQLVFSVVELPDPACHSASVGWRGSSGRVSLVRARRRSCAVGRPLHHARMSSRTSRRAGPSRLVYRVARPMPRKPKRAWLRRTGKCPHIGVQQSQRRPASRSDLCPWSMSVSRVGSVGCAMSELGRCCRKRDFAMSGEQHQFKFKCKCAILIQKIRPPGFDVQILIRLRKLFRQHRSKPVSLRTSIHFPVYPPTADLRRPLPAA